MRGGEGGGAQSGLWCSCRRQRFWNVGQTDVKESSPDLSVSQTLFLWLIYGRSPSANVKSPRDEGSEHSQSAFKVVAYLAAGMAESLLVVSIRKKADPVGSAFNISW